MRPMTGKQRDISRRAFDHATALWVGPEIQKRQRRGLVSAPFRLRAAQVLFPADSSPLLVRLNEEVQLAAQITKTDGVAPHINGELRRADIQQSKTSSYRHTTMVTRGIRQCSCGSEQGVIALDLRYNRRSSQPILWRQASSSMSPTPPLTPRLRPCLDPAYAPPNSQ